MRRNSRRAGFTALFVTLLPGWGWLVGAVYGSSRLGQGQALRRRSQGVWSRASQLSSWAGAAYDRGKSRGSPAAISSLPLRAGAAYGSSRRPRGIFNKTHPSPVVFKGRRCRRETAREGVVCRVLHRISSSEHVSKAMTWRQTRRQ